MEEQLKIRLLELVKEIKANESSNDIEDTYSALDKVVREALRYDCTIIPEARALVMGESLANKLKSKFLDNLNLEIDMVFNELLWESHLNNESEVISNVINLISENGWSRFKNTYNARKLRDAIFKDHESEIMNKIVEDQIHDAISKYLTSLLVIKVPLVNSSMIERGLAKLALSSDVPELKVLIDKSLERTIEDKNRKINQLELELQGLREQLL